MIDSELQEVIAEDVRRALREDVGSGDITAALIPEKATASARIITREAAVICGVEWVNEAFRQLDPRIEIAWQVADGDLVTPEQCLCTLSGPARALLTGERTALNFLQTLSATATLSRRYADAVAHTKTRVLDTRKTIPGLRRALKYAVTCGGCYNHRVGLYDGILIKENHIAAAGSITAAVAQARAMRLDVPVEVEVETLDELREALDAGADILLLDNFKRADLLTAVAMNKGQARLEASGGVTLETIPQIAETGVDYVSTGELTKHIHAVDLSMRFEDS
ncbi:carboxylating nicotinate-nucleotide diphosphorylase [Sulfuriflexus sp.]|uniref:carboxylating nicotinate-nucleotide diphosphorylase n=1 Tax=Sulfuriflexus sp. TaxID=2015443 RepID=UPI0028CE1868|nr:carboxylating nicotinate-nucleotide diphosphorylase [Sulfuriflexus sp.]MDT8405318.1 carboxylating nicotinate-nucleotide diphosphorylase [Sulfuriflexus sp.]